MTTPNDLDKLGLKNIKKIHRTLYRGSIAGKKPNE